MKTHTRQRCQCCALLVLIVVGQPARAADCRKSVRWHQSPPYSLRDTDGQVRGIDPEIAQTVLARMGCTANFVEMPSARAIKELESGGLDIMTSVVGTPERARFAHFSIPFYRHPNVLFVASAVQAKYSLKALGDIRNTDFRLGYQVNVSYGLEYEELKGDPAFAARLSPVASRQGAWRMIAAGRIDGFIADDETSQEEIRQLGLAEQIRRTDLPLQTTPSLIAFSRKTVDNGFVSRFDNELKTIIASGELAKIYERYGRCATVGPKRPCHASKPSHGKN